MALLNYLPVVQGSRVNLGVDAGYEESFILAPGPDDYPVGGYEITHTMLRAKLIAEAWVTATNEVAAGFVPVIQFPLSQLASAIVGIGGPGQGLPWSQTYGEGISGYDHFHFKVCQGSSAGRLSELALNDNLFQCGWVIRVRTY